MVGVAVLCLGPALAVALMVPVSLDELVTEADTIVRGSVVHQESRWDGRLIVTDVTLDVAETIKGEPAPQQTLRIAGGTVDEVTFATSNAPHFQDREEIIVFLDTAISPAIVVGHWQGKLTVQNGTVQYFDRRFPVADFLDEIRRSAR